MSNGNDVSKRVLARFKTAMPTIFRNLGDNTNWGFGTGREDPRMHLQTLDPEHRGKNELKVWLESKGQRVFEIAVEPDKPKDKIRAAKAFKSLEDELRRDRATVEHKWVQVMIANGWIKPILKDTTIELVLYPGFPTKFTVKVELPKVLPGLFAPNVVSKPRLAQDTIGFHAEHAMLVLNAQAPEQDHIDISLPPLIWKGQAP